MNLDEQKLIAFFGNSFAENVKAVLALEPATHVNLMQSDENGYYVEVVTPNPPNGDLIKIIDELFTSPVLHVDIQARLKEAGKLSLWQTSDTPPSIMLTS